MGAKVCRATIHLMLPAGTFSKELGTGCPRQALPPGRGARHPLRGSVGTAGPTAGLDTHWDVCHPRTWKTGTELGHALKHLHSTQNFRKVNAEV